MRTVRIGMVTSGPAVTAPKKLIERGAMPLSRHEQLVIAELEESLSRQDPRFTKNLSANTVYKRERRGLCWAIVGFIVGLAILTLFFTQSVPLGLAGLALMIASTLVFERCLRLMKRTSRTLGNKTSE